MTKRRLTSDATVYMHDGDIQQRDYSVYCQLFDSIRMYVLKYPYTSEFYGTVAECMLTFICRKL